MREPYHETEHGVLYHGDCLDVMREMADNSIDLTVTSPPYDNLRDYKGYSFDFESIAKELFRITKVGGVVVWVVNDATVNGSETGTSFKQALYFKEVGFNLHDTMIYEKDGISFPDNNRYQSVFEYMFMLSKGKPNVFNPIMVKTICHSKYVTNRQKDGTVKGKMIQSDKRERIRGNIWRYGAGYMKSAKRKFVFEHPAIFPEQLAIDHILSWSNVNDIILDCFMGSGTVGIASIRTNRKYIGIDISSEYLDIAARRIDAEMEQTDFLRDL